MLPNTVLSSSKTAKVSVPTGEETAGGRDPMHLGYKGHPGIHFWEWTYARDEKSTCLRKSPHRWERNKQANYSPSSVHSDKKRAILKSHGNKGHLHWAGNRTISLRLTEAKLGQNHCRLEENKDSLCREKS